jgi:hypothetical protein
VQWIEATADGLRLREEVVVATGQRTNVSIEAKFDGRDYPVTRSSLSDTIAYTRKGRRKIIGTGKKNGGVTLRETIAVAGDDETLTLTFGIFEGGRQVMGFAVFDRVE